MNQYDCKHILISDKRVSPLFLRNNPANQTICQLDTIRQTSLPKPIQKGWIMVSAD